MNTLIEYTPKHIHHYVIYGLMAGCRIPRNLYKLKWYSCRYYNGYLGSKHVTFYYTLAKANIDFEQK